MSEEAANNLSKELQRAGCKDPANPFLINKYKKLVEEYPFSLEHYYSSIQAHSFQTKFVELNPEIVEAIIMYYQHNVLKKPDLKEEQKVILARLESDVDRIIKSFGSSGTFVRLSRRSPKDALLDCKLCKSKVEDLLLQRFVSLTEDLELEIKVALECIVQGMRVTSGKEAMELILNSERVYHDMLLSDEFPTANLAGDGKYFVNIVIREWKDIPIESEFRAFVFQRKLSAISQYCDILYFGKEYVEEKSNYEILIRNKFEEVKDQLPVESCILDFAVLKDGTVYIVELNPFVSCCGSLFDWSVDREILENKKPFEFRIIDEPIPDMLSLVSEEWITLINNAKSKIAQEKQLKNNCIIN